MELPYSILKYFIEKELIFKNKEHNKHTNDRKQEVIQAIKEADNSYM